MLTQKRRPWIQRASIGLAAIMLALALAGCLDALSGAHGRLHRYHSGQCKPGPPLAGVYLPFRLHVRRRCVTVTGIVDCLKREPDGDIHIELRLSGAYRRLLTSANAYQRCPGHQGPHLVVEIIPQGEGLPIPDNSASLAGFVTPRAPRVGARVRVTGPYVLDTNALHDLIFIGKNVANWAEIHPAWNITVARSRHGRSRHGRSR
jgi:hypothetical protein